MQAIRRCTPSPPSTSRARRSTQGYLVPTRRTRGHSPCTVLFRVGPVLASFRGFMLLSESGLLTVSDLCISTQVCPDYGRSFIYCHHRLYRMRSLDISYILLHCIFVHGSSSNNYHDDILVKEDRSWNPSNWRCCGSRTLLLPRRTMCSSYQDMVHSIRGLERYRGYRLEIFQL